MRIAFYSPHLCLRGTTVAMYDYAYYNQLLLGNESFIIYNDGDHRNNSTVIEKFKNSFSFVEPIAHNSLLDAKLKDINADAIYIIKAGRNDERQSPVCKNLIHCTGMEHDPHGEVYAYVSKWLSDTCSEGRNPYVPHIVDLHDEDKNLRQDLGIPDEAFVFGRTGGKDTWSLSFANKAVEEVLQKREDCYFIFQNTERFTEHERVFFIKSTAHMTYKTRFINSCDAMIHARYEGESFGLACGEFSLRNKPVITWNGSNERNHIETLKEKGFYYSNQEELSDILLNFKKEPHKDWNCYKQFSPAKVMKKFKEVFLD